MRGFIARLVLGATLLVGVACGGSILDAGRAYGQSITGLGQTDQRFNVCQQPTVLDAAPCNEHDHGGHEGGKGRQ